MACSRTSALELVLELVQELQIFSSRTTVLKLVLELVLDVQMVGSRTSVLELKFKNRSSRTEHFYF